MEEYSRSHKKADQWKRSSWSAPEVQVAAGDKEVVASTEKQIASDDGKQVVPAGAPEVVTEENLPEAKDPEDEKEAIIWDYPSDQMAKPDPPPSSQWRRDHKVMLLLCGGTILLLVVAVALGAGLGVALHRSSGNKSSAVSNTGGTTLVDASIIASPTSTTPPLGTRALALSAPRDSPATCLTQQDQQVAWNCNLAPDAHLALTVQSSSGSSEAQLFYASNQTRIGYGAQAPSMNTSLNRLLAVIDETEPAYGMAFYFQQLYDKVVVLPENAITASSTTKSRKLRRRPFDIPSEMLQGRTLATSGEKPWICVFNNTLLEAFMYANEPANLSTTTRTGTSFLATTSSAMRASSTSPETVTATTMYPSTSATASPSSSSSNFFWSQITTFPLLVKLSERRLAYNAIKPYCQQYEVLDDGSANWIADSDGNPVIVELDESAPDSSSVGAGEACRCQWLSGAS